MVMIMMGMGVLDVAMIVTTMMMTVIMIMMPLMMIMMMILIFEVTCHSGMPCFGN